MPAKKKVESKSSKTATSKKSSKEEIATPENETQADALRREGIVVTYALTSKKQHRNVRDISVSNLTVLFHGSPLVEDAELTLNYGNRYGYIGRNGCGKTTFMKVIGARCFPIPDGIDIFHLKEEIEASELTAKEAVMSVDTQRATLEAEAEELNDMISSEDGSDDAEAAMERLNQVYERLEELDAATAETRCCKILSGLGFTPEKQNKKTKEFSGGWRMRIALARALFIQPTLLLLDEPTNHLDMEAVVWLEDYLSKWKKILFLVSHSQDFMNNVCTHMVHHTQKQLVYYSGNYDQFEQTKSEKEEEQEKRYKLEQDQIKHMKDYVARFGQGNAKMARQAQSKEKVLDKMLRSGLTEKVEQERTMDFKFPDPSRLSPPVLQCTDITFGYPGCEILYENVDFGVDLDSRVALVGPNGAGKSTLLKLMTGDLIPVHGAVRPHAHLRIAKFSQHFIDVLDLTMCPLDYFLKLWPETTREEGRKFLGRFGISGSTQTQMIGQLSDGQKSRVVLAKMARENPHMLFLDEPTNHLDMESIDSLAKAINSFGGGMILVSHDMRLISQVAKEIWLCDHRTISRYHGEIADFKMALRGQMMRDGLVDGAPPPPSASPMFTPLSSLSASTKMSSSSSSTSSASTKSSGLSSVKSGGGISLPSSSSSSPTTTSSSTSTSTGSTSGKYVPPNLRNKTPSTEEQEAAALETARQELEALKLAERERREKEREERERERKERREREKREKAEAAAALAAGGGAAAGEDDEEGDTAEKRDAIKARRKAEKDARVAQEKKEEEEREQRRLEKIRDNEAAKKMLEAEAKAREEFRAMKAAKDAKLKAEEEAAALKEAEEKEQRRQEREARRRRKAEQRAAEAERVRAEVERLVLGDPWTQEQQLAFEQALLVHTPTVLPDKHERWTQIARDVNAVPTPLTPPPPPPPSSSSDDSSADGDLPTPPTLSWGPKTLNQCLTRYRFLKDYVSRKKRMEAATAAEMALI